MPVLSRSRSLHAMSPDPTPSPDQAAFARLYGEFFDPIFWYCRHRLGDVQAAEDAASLVFANALAAGPRYDDPSLRSWLFGIAHNVLANTLRGRRSWAPLETALEVADRGPLPEEVVMGDDERAALLRALARLPTDQRRVVELRMAGLTGPEIARLLERSPAAIKMLQQRAFVQLRAVLAEDRSDEETDGHG